MVAMNSSRILRFFSPAAALYRPLMAFASSARVTCVIFFSMMPPSVWRHHGGIRLAGNNSGEATTQISNIPHEAMRHVGDGAVNPEFGKPRALRFGRFKSGGRFE